MLASLSRALYRYASGQAIVPLLLVCAGYFWIFNFSSLPFSNPALVAGGCGDGLLDLRLYYDAGAAQRALACYGEGGRAIYRRFLVADMSFVMFYGAGFALLLSRLLAALTAPASRWRAANLLPLVIASADGVENLALFSLLAAYPGQLPALGDLAGLATLVKHGLTALSLVVLAACIGRLLWRRMRV